MNKRLVIGLLLAVAVVLFLWLRGRGPASQAQLPARPAPQASPTDGTTSSGSMPTGPGLPVADAYGQVQGIKMLLDERSVGVAVIRFDASQSRDERGRELVKFVYDFGDGNVETSTDGRIEHEFPYDYDTEAPLVKYNVTITGHDSEGKTGVIHYTAELDNAVGVEKRHGRLLVEASPCVMSHAPDASMWFCGTVLRNPQNEPVLFDKVAFAYQVSPTNLSPELAAKLREPGGMSDLGLVMVKPIEGSFPAEIAPGEAVEVTLMVPDKQLEGAEIESVTLTGQGKGKTSQLPARTLIRGQFGARRTWMSEAEMNRSGIPRPPRPLDLPGDPLPAGADPSKPPAR
jgi:hypothetical protein